MPRVGTENESLSEQPEFEQQTLFEQKQSLFLHIKQEFSDLTPIQQDLVLTKVFGQSIEDGFLLASDLGAEDVVRQIFFRPEIQSKHTKLFQKVKGRMAKLGILTTIGAEQFLGANEIKETLTYLVRNEQKDFMSTKCRALLAEIDEYYARVFAQRMQHEIDQSEQKQKNKKLSQKDAPKLLPQEKQKRRSGYDMGESALERMHMMAEPHYYTKDFIDEIVWPALQQYVFSLPQVYDKYKDTIKTSREEFEKNVSQRNLPEHVFVFFLDIYCLFGATGWTKTNALSEVLTRKESFVKTEDCELFLRSIKQKAYIDACDRLQKKGDIDDDTLEKKGKEVWNEKEQELNRKLKKIRYRGDLVDMRLKKLAEDKLRAELTAILGKNQTLEQDTVTGEYSVYQDVSRKTEQKEQNKEGESTLEDIQEFFDFAEWTKAEVQIGISKDQTPNIGSLRENEKGEIFGMLYDNQGNRLSGFCMNDFDKNQKSCRVTWELGSEFQRINFPDGRGYIQCKQTKANPRLSTVEIQSGHDEKKCGIIFENILPETLKKVGEGEYEIYGVELSRDGSNGILLSINLSEDGFISFQAVSHGLEFSSTDETSSLSISDSRDKGIANAVNLQFSDGERRIFWGECDPNSVFVGSNFCACVLKSTNGLDYYLLHNKNLDIKEKIDKGDYGEKYSTLAPLYTQNGKVGLYIGSKAQKLWILRPDGSPLVPGGIDVDPRNENFQSTLLKSVALETPKGMGAVLSLNRESLFISGDGTLVSQKHLNDYQDVRQVQCLGSQYVIPVPYRLVQLQKPRNDASCDVGFDFMNYDKFALWKSHGMLDFRNRDFLFSVNNGYVTVAGQRENKFVLYRRPLSELKHSVEPKQQAPEATVGEKTKIEPSQMHLKISECLLLLNMLSRKYKNTDEFLERYNDYHQGKVHSSPSWLEKKRAQDPTDSVFKSMMAQNPKEFLKINAAIPDSASSAQVDFVLEQLYGDTYRKIMSAQEKQKTKNKERLNPADYLRSRSVISLGGESDPRKAEKEGKEVLYARTELKEPLVTGIYGKWNNGVWEKVDLPVSPVITEPSHQQTFTLPVDENQTEYQLPRGINSKIVEERVRGITGGIAFGFGKKEIPLTVVKQSDGTTVVRLNQKNIREIVYSEVSSKISPVPRDISLQEYSEMKRTYIREQGSDLIEEIATSLPPEWLDFLNSLKELPPLEQVMEIQNFVRTIGYYDFENSEMEGKKEGKPFGERIDAMKYRMEEMKKKNNKKVLNTKQLAGICGDFALLNAALLRKAGFLSVVIEEFVPNGKGTKTSDFHAVAGFLWPGKNGEYNLFLSDATPSGTDEKEQGFLSQIQQPSIEKQVAVQQQAVQKVLEEKTEQVKTLLAQLEKNPEAVAQLRNGILEESVNTILAHGVKESHCHILETVLGLARYGNIDIGEEILLRSAVEDEVFFARGKKPVDDTPAGTKMFALFEEYVKRYVQSQMRQGIVREDAVQKSLQTLSKIIDIASPHLEKMEQLAARAILTDLKAKHMKK